MSLKRRQSLTTLAKYERARGVHIGRGVVDQGVLPSKSLRRDSSAAYLVGFFIYCAYRTSLQSTAGSLLGKGERAGIIALRFGAGDRRQQSVQRARPTISTGNRRIGTMSLFEGFC